MMMRMMREMSRGGGGNCQGPEVRQRGVRARMCRCNAARASVGGARMQCNAQNNGPDDAGMIELF